MLSDYSDYGVVLVYLGRYEQARAVFTAIEARQPGLYATAANLGTVYELLGQNERALYWIQRAVRINPRSHYGSEWIHVNILRAKLRGAGAVNARFLLGTDFGTAATPVTTISQTSLKHLRAALYFQLAERMSFIKPKDAVVGQLLFELGNTYALTSDVESALDVYDQARAYGYGGGVLARRYAYFQWLKYREDFLGLLVLLGLLGLAGFGALRLGRGLKRAYRRRISKQEAAPAAIEVSSRARADKVGARPGRPD